MNLALQKIRMDGFRLGVPQIIAWHLQNQACGDVKLIHCWFIVMFGFRGAVTCIHYKSCSEKNRALFWLFSLLTQFQLFPFLFQPLSPVFSVHCDKTKISEI